MTPQSCKSPNLGDFETKSHLDVGWRGAEYIVRGKVVASPKSRPW